MRNSENDQLVGFSYDKKSTNIAMWKDKDC